MHKLWVVLKVSLTRPWVWMMLPMVLLQAIPLVQFAPKNPITEYRNVIPAFDRPDVVVSSAIELNEFSKKQEIGRIEGLECRDIPDMVTLDDHNALKSAAPSIVPKGYVQTFGTWPLLDRLPQLKSLVLQPPNLLNSEGWKRIRNLKQLEVLNLEHINMPQADQENLQQLLDSTLSGLPTLRQLNLNNFGGRYDWKLPPLPRIETLILGFNNQMEGNLESLSQSSPFLHTLVLHTYENMQYTDRMIDSFGKMPRLRKLIICSSSKTDTWRETQRQVEFLRARLPQLNIERGVYSPNRVFLHLFLSFIAGFLPFLVWFQSGLKLAQPLAAVMPGHRGPHLFWPVTICAACGVVFVTLSVQAGTFWPAAVSIAAMEVTLVASILPGHDLTPRWRSMIQYISGVDVLSLMTGVGLGLAAPYFADAYLMGDFPKLATLLMFWFILAGVWKIWRATRLHRILAESGMTGIPGLNIGMQHLMDQPYKPAPGWSLANWQMKRMENAVDRKIAAMDRSNWIDMLRRASPSNPGMWVGLLVVGIFIVFFRMFLPAAQRNQLVHGPMIAIGAWQATMMFLMMNIMMWIGRRGTIVHEFLRPIGRASFWRSLRLAIFHDLKWAVLFGLTGALYATYLGNKNSLHLLTILNATVSAIGLLAWIHGWVTLSVIGKRLFLHATLGIITCAGMFGAAISSVTLTVGAEPAFVAAGSLAITVLAIGGLLQWGIARKLPDWELA